MEYRREIDGLRALAVLPVILFHGGFELFSGGFVGVDIFFVISGYLITTIILAEINAGCYSVLTFYERRARRILPALLFVMMLCVPFAWLWMLPEDFKSFSKSLVAAAGCASNILFAEESGYFATAAELKPLLHTWSLAVEEQYYLLFPVVLLLTRRLPRRTVFALVFAIALASLAAAHLGATRTPETNYFMLLPRGWELLAGSLLAFYESVRKAPGAELSPFRRELFAAVGLFMVVVPVFAFGRSTPFPSLYALVPVLGAVLVLAFANHSTQVGRVLGCKPLVVIGLISYSAYLWHQPLFAFARLRSLTEPDAWLLAVLAAMSLVLAYFSWRFVELPFRNRRNIGRSGIFAFSVVASVVVVGVGMVGYSANGFDERRVADGSLARDLNARLRTNAGLGEKCEGGFTLDPACRTSNEPEVLVWGDSFAMHLVPGLLASRPDARIIQMTLSSCGPFDGLAPIDEGTHTLHWARKCLEFNRQVMAWLRTSSSVKYAVLSSPFVQYTSSDWPRFLTEKGIEPANTQVALKAFLATLDTLAAHGISPVVFAPPPTSTRDIGRCVVRSKQFAADPTDCDLPRAEARERQAAVRDLLQVVARRYPVVWLDEGICEGERCRVLQEDTFIYRDKGHLSYEGSALIGLRMDFYRLVTSNKGATMASALGLNVPRHYRGEVIE